MRTELGKLGKQQIDEFFKVMSLREVDPRLLQHRLELFFSALLRVKADGVESSPPGDAKLPFAHEPVLFRLFDPLFGQRFHTARLRAM